MKRTVQFRTLTLLILVFTGNAGATEGSAHVSSDNTVEALGNDTTQSFSDGIFQEFDDGSAEGSSDGITAVALPSDDGSVNDYSDGLVEDVIDGSVDASGEGIILPSGDRSHKDFTDGSAQASSDGSAQTFKDGSGKKLLVEVVTNKEESTELIVRGIDIAVFLRGLMTGVQLWAEDWWSLISANINSPAEILRQRKLFSDSVNLFSVRRRKREASDPKCIRGRKAAVCGIAPPRGGEGQRPRSKRIVNGTTSRKGQWPWMVSIYIKDRFDKVTNSCGGALIDRDIVMSAAHCFTDPAINWTVNVDQLNVRLGSTRNPFDQYIDPDEGAIVSKVRKAKLHPNFDSISFDNDLALLLLDHPEVYRRDFMPICLPSSKGNDHVGKTGVITGWGLLKFSGSLPPLLQEADVQILSGKQCYDWYKNRTSLVNTNEAFLCAGYRDGFKDACTGDSGGPLMIQDERGRWTICGIVSHGYKCAQLQSPGFYVNVSNYRPWIDETMKLLHKSRQQNL